MTLHGQSDSADKAKDQLMAAMERLLREGQRVWEPHQHDPGWDDLSAALTALYMGWKFAANAGVLPRGPGNAPDGGAIR